MSKKSLNRCPFCGEVVSVGMHGLYDDYDKSFYVSCENTKCSARPCTRAYHEAEQEAINAWNKRRFDYEAILQRKARNRISAKSLAKSLLSTVYDEEFIDEFYQCLLKEN